MSFAVSPKRVAIGILVGVGLLAIALTPPFPPAPDRAKVARARYDLRTAGAAIEAYRTDHGEYPAMVPLRFWVADKDREEFDQTRGYAQMTVAGLTTPTRYVAAEGVLIDVFTVLDALHLPCIYATNGETWLLGSCGPDRDYDLDRGVAKLLDGDESEIRSRLAPFAYDPTNGTPSGGDIVWTKADQAEKGEQRYQ